MSEASSELRWGVERRLEFIEFRLYWEGGINRSDITTFFGVSVPQASSDLSQYQALADGNMTYDKSDKRYVAAKDFRPRFLKPDPDKYLAQLSSIAERLVEPEETWLADPPSLDSMPIPRRRVSPDVLRLMLSAVRSGGAVEVHYQSMSDQRPDPVWRSMSPHAFASDGFRWHVRAFCHIDNRFKDFLLSRCLDGRLAGDALASGTADEDWNSFVEVRLKPNPKLSKSQQKVIADDYDMKNGGNKVAVRKALLYYFHKRLRLDVADALDNPREVPVVIANRAAYEKALAEATG